MTYTKPEVAVLGNASLVIESLLKKTHYVNDSGIFANPAYDLDE